MNIASASDFLSDSDALLAALFSHLSLVYTYSAKLTREETMEGAAAAMLFLFVPTMQWACWGVCSMMLRGARACAPSADQETAIYLLLIA